MDDKFLYQLREQPDAEFIKNLYRKLSENNIDAYRRGKMNYHPLPRNKSLGLIAAILSVTLIVAMAISLVRALVSSLLLYLAGQAFEVVGDYPGDNYPGDEESIELQVMLLNGDEERVYVGENADPFANTIELEWFSNNKEGLVLLITDKVSEVSEIVGPGSIKEILLEGNYPAVLITGGWDADNKVWDKNINVRLHRLVDNLTYETGMVGVFLLSINDSRKPRLTIATGDSIFNSG